MKKFWIWLTAAALALSLAACTASGRVDVPAGSAKKPPALTVAAGNERITVSSGEYSWSCDNGIGPASKVIACGLHPLDGAKSLEVLEVSDCSAELRFDSAPDRITVCCWSDAHWGDYDAASEPVTVHSGSIELKPGGYVYEVTAEWESIGSASYGFYAVTGHAHQLADHPQTVEDPISGFCGNLSATVCLDGKEYTIVGSDAVTLTDILVNLAYDPQKSCRCMSEFSVSVESGTEYDVNLTEGFVRCGQGQADLTAEQTEQIRQIIQR